MENVKTEIKQIKNQILLGILEDKIDSTWGMLIVDNCNKALTLCGVVVSEAELCDYCDSKKADTLICNDCFDRKVSEGA
tara:strand:+ start:331 stop:567 length:237 start_codon:yes stop_codon:yes gene_type:complete